MKSAWKSYRLVLKEKTPYADSQPNGFMCYNRTPSVSQSAKNEIKMSRLYAQQAFYKEYLSNNARAIKVIEDQKMREREEDKLNAVRQ